MIIFKLVATFRVTASAVYSASQKSLQLAEELKPMMGTAAILRVRDTDQRADPHQQIVVPESRH
jgi:hypothetical protein